MWLQTTSNAKGNDDNDDDDNKTLRKRRGMGLSKTSITGKWDREWKRLYTTHNEEGKETDRIREKKERREKKSGRWNYNATTAETFSNLS